MNVSVEKHCRPFGAPGLLVVARCLALDSLAAATADLLDGAGIRCLLLKGPATAARLLGDRRDQRVYSDVDLLVAPEDFAASEKVLARNGYRPRTVGVRDSELLWHERAWRAPNDDLTVDLHRGFAGVRNSAAFWTAVWAGREHLTVAGEVIAVPGPVAAALILALHAANPGPSPRPLDDLVQARTVLPPPVWAAAVELARQVDAESACRTAIELLPGGVALADQLGLARQVGLAARLAARQASPLSVSLAKLLDVSSGMQLAGYVGRKLLPSPALLRMREVGVGSGPSALALGYLRRWARAAAGARTASVELRDARRPDHSARLRRSRVGIMAATRIVTSPDAVRTVIWSVRTIRQVRQQLPHRPFGEVVLSGPPASDRRCESAMKAVLRLRRASCLERALLRQRFDAANGLHRTLIIGVSNPANGFRAHSWLEGDRQRDPSMRAIFRHPAPSQLRADPR